MPRVTKQPHVEPRTNSIRIVIWIDNERKNLPLKVDGAYLRPTVPNLAFARRQAKEIGKRMAEGAFDIAEFFPDEENSATAQTFAAAAVDWLDSKGQLAAATISNYESGIRKWKDLLGADTPMEKFTHQMIAKAIGKEAWPSPKAANNYLVALRGIFKFHFAGPKANLNPMIGIENLKHIKGVPDPLSVKERDAILAHMEKNCDPRVHAYFTFAFFTGMRPEELIALQWGDIDFNLNLARVQRVRTFRGSERDGTKTGNGRDVYLLDQALNALKIMKPHTFLKGEDIFESPVTGRPWHDERSQRDTFWKPTLKKLGIRMRRAYSTRHTYATVGLMGGLNPAFMAQQMGHASTKMFFEIYARWIESDDKTAQRAAMARAFGGSTETEKVVNGE